MANTDMPMPDIECPICGELVQKCKHSVEEIMAVFAEGG